MSSTARAATQLPEHKKSESGYGPNIGDTSKMSRDEKGEKNKAQGEKDLAAHKENPLDHPAYATFAARVKTLIGELKTDDDAEALAQDLWLKTYNALESTDAAYDAVKKDPKSGRTDMGEKAYKDLLPAFKAVTDKLSELLSEHGKSASTWAFWSTSCARAAGETHCEMSLETGAIGWLFDNMNLTGDWDMQLWGALSEAYAKAAVSDIKGRTYHGFVGPGVGDLTIYSKVEEPAIKTATKDFRVKPKMRFHAVAPAEGKNPWDAAFHQTISGGDFKGTYASYDDRDLARKTADIRWKEQQRDEEKAGIRKKQAS